MNFKSLTFVSLMALPLSVLAKNDVVESWRSYVERDAGISINMPNTWNQTNNKTFEKIFSSGTSSRAVDGRAIDLPPCALFVAEGVVRFG